MLASSMVRHITPATLMTMARIATGPSPSPRIAAPSTATMTSSSFAKEVPTAKLRNENRWISSTVNRIWVTPPSRQ